jgi:hypothetical protein
MRKFDACGYHVSFQNGEWILDEMKFLWPNLEFKLGDFEYFSTVFVKNWPKKSIFLEIFPNAAQGPIRVDYP